MKVKKIIRFVAALALFSAFAAAQSTKPNRANIQKNSPLREVNQVAAPKTGRAIVILGATLIDGGGGAAVANSMVVVRGDRILFAGRRGEFPIPARADVVNAEGLTLLPGLVDAHFHIDGDDALPALFLTNGVTSLRDPGQWIEAYDAAQKGAPVPRLFLTGPHFDYPPPAYPNDSFVVRDDEEARRAVRRFAEQGASAFKVYFRLPVGLIKTISEEAHLRGIPVTSHLEIVDADEAVLAGVDGIEHITSFGTSLMPPREAEKYKQSILKDNNARREGRYEMWSRLDLNSAKTRAVIDLLVKQGTFVSPTLAIFERRAGDEATSEIHLKAFRNMLALTGMMHKAGVKIVVGSHSVVPHAERGWAYQRELELLVDAGLTPMQALTAATLENARFFRSENRIGSVEKGKLADLVLVEGDPLKDIKAMRRVRRVMLNGVWIPQKDEKNQGGAR